MSRRRANARGPSQGRPKHREDPAPRPKQDETIPPEAAEGMGLPLNDDEKRKRVEALRASQKRVSASAGAANTVIQGVIRLTRCFCSLY